MANNRKIQEVNAGSMADIAFLLLIFFLVATTMNTDNGIQRVLPPIPDNQVDQIPVKERNLLLVMVDRLDRVSVGRDVIDISQLKDKVKDFMMDNASGESEIGPERELTDIPILGQYMVTKGIISLQNDRGTSYGLYVQVQNELTRAINELRSELAYQRFGKDFFDLNEDQRDAITKAVPSRISEAEPRDIGGGN